MPASDMESYKQLPSLCPSAVVELRGLHLHGHIAKNPVTIETEKGERRISKPRAALARKGADDAEDSAVEEAQQRHL